MEVLFDDIKKTLDAEDVSLPNPTEHAQATVRSAGSKRLPGAPQDTPTLQPGQQLEVSREVERALRGMKVGDEASVTWTTTAPSPPRLPKDIPDSVQAAVEMRNTSPGLADLTRGVVR